MLKIITLNMLIDLTNWNLRGQCIVDEIKELDPDIIAFQEVSLPFNTAQWVADQLEGYQVHLVPDTGLKGKEEALALLTRIPILESTCLDLVTQNRKAQVVTFEHKYQPYTLVNTHLFWQDGHSIERLEQTKLIRSFLANYPEDYHKIICGDFNATPDSPTIQYMKEVFISSFESFKNQDPKITFPSPLLNIVTAHDKSNQNNNQVTNKGKIIDYIFLSKSLQSRQCEIVFRKPHHKDSKIYASDHYGLMAIIEPLNKTTITRGK
ncbi:MAG: endonuclease/exonuclease/phosphatase family protein [Anaerolineaceae bacterium]|nr:endonuclease/exonuclease/phosphatase family protein [Anaerolineaceae bacterium]